MKRIIAPKTDDPKEMEKFFRRLCDILNDLATVNSSATDVAGLKNDFNALLAKLRG